MTDRQFPARAPWCLIDLQSSIDWPSSDPHQATQGPVVRTLVKIRSKLDILIGSAFPDQKKTALIPPDTPASIAETMTLSKYSGRILFRPLIPCLRLGLLRNRLCSGIVMRGVLRSETWNRNSVPRMCISRPIVRLPHYPFRSPSHSYRRVVFIISTKHGIMLRSALSQK